MYRFLAFAWDRANPVAAQTVVRLTRKLKERLPNIKAALTCDGLSVYQASDAPGSFDVYEGRGEPMVVLGKLFHADMNEQELPRRVVFNEATTLTVTKSRGRALIDHFWGGYVAFIHDAASSRTFVVRDPTADLPCYVTSLDGLSIIFSCMEDCIALGVRQFSVNWRYVISFLQRPYIDVRDTGLEEVAVVAPGECLELRAGVECARHNYWNIVDIAADDPLENVDVAVQAARRTLLACINAWTADHPQVMLRLSGGLDSSIVLAGLMHAPSRPEVTCIHHFDGYAHADERRFARMAVEGASASSGRSCKLLECARTPESFKIETLLTLPRTACPARYAGYLSERYVGPPTTANGRAIQFSGQGGDPTFLRLHNDAPAVDYVWRHGLGRHLLRVVMETAQESGNFYSVFAHAIRDGLLVRDRPFVMSKPWHMINPEVVAERGGEAEQRLVPAWRRAAPHAARRLSPEKLLHIDAMALSWRTIDPYERVGDWEWLAPINSQPVMELFARMPLYVLMDGAQDRTIARRAFEGYLPPQLLTRRTKSYFSDFSLSVIRRHEAFLRELFLDGILVKERILDRRRVEEHLARLHSSSENVTLRLLGPQLNMEAWLRNWQRGAQVHSRATAA